MVIRDHPWGDTLMNRHMNTSPIFRSVALVVDDDQSTCDVVAAVLEQEGFTVVTANSGEEALEQFGSHVFDIVFTDVCMDGISGLELLNRISNMDSTVKTVIMTAHGGFDTVLQALKGGAYDYIEKPILNHARLAATARKAHSHALLERDNVELIVKLKASHSKLADANAQLLELNQKLESMAITDPLTGLKNRRYIDDILRQEVALYKRYGNPFSILLIDVDNFKTVNDNYGHANGDDILKFLSSVLRENSRESDTVGRFGGEEFFLLLHGTAREGAQIVADRILEQVKRPIEIDGELVSVTVSIGIAHLDDAEDINDPKELVKRSDEALYMAKNNGRDRVETYSAAANDDKNDERQAAG